LIILKPLNILDYSPDNLATALANEYTTIEAIKNKDHFLYFIDYLGTTGINAKKIVVESHYISKDYLSDYSSYYSLCYEEYAKYCKRIHFFSVDFDETTFKKALLDKSDENSIWKNYLGFIVVKPLPYTVIGITVLKQYPSSATNNRIFFGIRKYTIHIFGRECHFDSLAFQEQDTVVSACATTAIWSTLQKASIDHHTVLKTPTEITHDAGLMSLDGSRMFPNKNGLDILQMCQAIEKSGLVSELRKAEPKSHPNEHKSSLDNDYIKQLIYAYSEIGIPMILIVAVPDDNEYGYHAITISGYKMKDAQFQPPSPDISLVANDIEKIYVHDDQWGPFSRVEFKNNDEIITNWTRFHPRQHPTYAPYLILPVYPKIRLSYDDIQTVIVGINAILFNIFGNNTTHNFSWSIKLKYSNDYKNEISTTSLQDNDKLEILVDDFPKYLWCATAYVGKIRTFDFLFDATDIANGMFALEVISYDQTNAAFFLNYITKNKALVLKFIKHPLREKFYDFLLKQF